MAAKKKATRATAKTTKGTRRVEVTDANDQVIMESTEWLPELFVNQKVADSGIPFAWTQTRRNHRHYSRRKFGGHYDVEVLVMLPCTAMNVEAAMDKADELCLKKLTPAAKKVAEAFARAEKKRQ